jgi:hypothetical protein
MNISLPTGKVLSISVYEYLFLIPEEDVDLFYQSCIADDLGTIIEDPFSNKEYFGKLEIDEVSDIPDELLDI